MLRIPPVSNTCCPCSRCSSTETSWKTTTKSLTLKSFPLSLMEKVPSTTARPQQPSCLTKLSPSLCQPGIIYYKPHWLWKLKTQASCVVVGKKNVWMNVMSVWDVPVMAFFLDILTKLSQTGLRQTHSLPVTETTSIIVSLHSILNHFKAKTSSLSITILDN